MWRERFLRVPGVPAQYAAGQPNRAILRKKQGAPVSRGPLFLDMEWMDFLFYKHTSRCVSADYFRQRPMIM